MLTKKSLDLADAKKIAAAAVAKAQAERWTVVVAVLDAGGHLLYLERADGTQLGSIEVAQSKARTALLFKRPSKALEEVVLGSNVNMMSLPGATPIEGGLPIVHEGEVVGAIGVSGVQSNQDGQVALAGAEAVQQL
ncbi:MAG: heme-binding protein [Steroidobacteraceae bacterium]